VLRLLEAHGWRVAYARGDVNYLCRPGKHGRACSATLGFVGDTILYVFSTNATPFEAQHSYDAFGIYARLEHASDFTAAARALVAMGYGEHPRSSPTASIQREAGIDVDPWEGISTLRLKPYQGYQRYRGIRNGVAHE
jgi:hypothetical protein